MNITQEEEIPGDNSDHAKNVIPNVIPLNIQTEGLWPGGC
jgi:hypothetical protein